MRGTPDIKSCHKAAKRVLGCPKSSQGSRETDMPRMFRLSWSRWSHWAASCRADRGAGADQARRHDAWGRTFPRPKSSSATASSITTTACTAIVLAMQRAADPANKLAYRDTSVTISGSGFDWHDVESYFRPNAIGNYSFDEQQQRRLQQARQIVRRRHHDGLQPVPDPSQAEVRVHRICEEGQRHRARQGREASVLHVLGLCRQAGNDGATGRGLYGRRQ